MIGPCVVPLLGVYERILADLKAIIGVTSNEENMVVGSKFQLRLRRAHGG